ncbi:unnamed protein product [Gordionus sp. m RMFG-2023]|uniref:ubiquitin-associated domain-containing protein 1-like n=1 Tax=Gordionus sp. m RMFG-2023 TaxID=3053472 RepID=UPI0030E1077F
MKLNIFNKEGDICKLNVEPDATIEKLKFMALGHFGAYLENPTEKQRASIRFKLLHIKQSRTLDDQKTISQESIRDLDEILLIKKPPVFYDDKKDFPLGPSLKEIIIATATLPQKDLNNITPKLKPYASDFQTEIKRVLITLIQTSHRLLCLNPQASHIFQQYHDKLNTPAQNPSEGLNQASVSRLVEMGFNEKLAIKALLLNKMDSSRAAEWLLERSEMDDNFDNNSPAIDNIIARDGGDKPTSIDSPNYAATSSPKAPPVNYSNDIMSIENDTPEKILKAFRAFKSKQFSPDPQALANLKEMGFEEKDIQLALAMCNNSEDAACEWLLQDKNRNDANALPSVNLKQHLPSEKHGPIKEHANEEFLTLPQNSPICKALLADPTILLGLNNPKMFMVLLNMYESFVQTQALNLGQWFNDSDAAMLLGQIFRIYHAEKYSLSDSSAMSSTIVPPSDNGNSEHFSARIGDVVPDFVVSSDEFWPLTTTAYNNPYTSGDESQSSPNYRNRHTQSINNNNNPNNTLFSESQLGYHNNIPHRSSGSWHDITETQDRALSNLSNPNPSYNAYHTYHSPSQQQTTHLPSIYNNRTMVTPSYPYPPSSSRRLSSSTSNPGTGMDGYYQPQSGTYIGANRTLASRFPYTRNHNYGTLVPDTFNTSRGDSGGSSIANNNERRRNENNNTGATTWVNIDPSFIPHNNYL